jgi:hypothetical protein
MKIIIYIYVYLIYQHKIKQKGNKYFPAIIYYLLFYKYVIVQIINIHATLYKAGALYFEMFVNG